MRKWMITLSTMLIASLMTGCAASNDSYVTIQKKGKSGYTFFAYKNRIDAEDASSMTKVLAKGEWTAQNKWISKSRAKTPDYRFYFNNRPSGKSMVMYHIWASDYRLIIKKDGQSLYHPLNKEDSEQLRSFLASFEK
ncbi:hypothetical protein [Bacillus sp. 1P06AnD]|uniref:hypothetical protein n=1 Tax=Bacillus sp. 1P06AnD TaxID=3132208 RepID=UPI0039A10F65